MIKIIPFDLKYARLIVNVEDELEPFNTESKFDAEWAS
jgi:hypothetical protein